MPKHSRARQTVDERDPRWVAFGRKLQQLRAGKGWKAMDVAKLIEVDPATYSHIENGKRRTGPERQTIENLAQLYETTVDELLGEPRPATDAKTPHGSHRDVFPRVDSAEGADLYAAVSAALYAVLQDVLSALGESQRRTETHAQGETRRTGTDLAPRGFGR